MYEVAYALKESQDKNRWLYLSSVGGIPEAVWVPKWHARRLFEKKSDVAYWKKKKGGVIVRIRKLTIKASKDRVNGSHPKPKAILTIDPAGVQVKPQEESSTTS